MILIISDEICPTTNHVIDWLYHFKINFLRINENDKCFIEKFEITSKNWQIVIKCNDKKIDLKKISTVWYRRGDINLYYDKIIINKLSKIKNQINFHLNTEIRELREFIYQQLDKKRNINSPRRFHVNKLECLLKASESGLYIPNTEIITNIILNKNKNKITKFICGAPSIYNNKSYTSWLTSQVTKKTLANIKNPIFPSLIQDEIKKEYEIRVFYIERKCYSMAIFSQNDPQTKTDFRNYNSKIPNRVCPFKLPLKIKKSIIKFMDSILLNCGSLDLIKTQTGKYIFLEVNPIGQFGMVSHPCNYDLHKIIAKKLIENDKKARNN